MVVLDVLTLAAGIALLVTGAEALVRGGSRLAAIMRVAPLVIGLTVVSFGTSMPELVVGVIASYQGDSSIAVGNVVGSNVFNILGVLGPAALVAPIAVHAAVVRREVPLMVLVTLVVVALALDGGISRLEGGLLLVGLAAYTGFAYWTARREPPEAMAEFEEAIQATASWGPVRAGAYVVGGVVLLVVGGTLVVDAAVDLARSLGVSERVIALTIIAAGTSLPELATSLVAAFRKQMDIAVGNVVGSNVFNLLGILGAAALVRPLPIGDAVLRFDFPVMVIVALVTVPLVITRRRISRPEGLVLVAGYVVYVWLLLSYYR